MTKLIVLAISGLVGLGLAGILPAAMPQEPPPPPKAKAKKKADPKKAEAGPAGDLRRAYDLLTRLRAEERDSGRTDERLRDWVDRAAKFYRDGVRAFEDGDRRLAHEYGAIAHDLARAADHSRNAARLDRARRDDDLPPPPDGPGAEESGDRTRRDLRRIYDRVRDLRDEKPAPGSAFYLDACRDLYNAARRDAEAGRDERAGELARAADALSHVAEHLGHVADGRDGPRDEPPPERKRERPDRKDRGGDDLPPPL